ncbi:MAG: aldehyde dehydrogenase family protein, partial [Acidimicrobiia bacterium]
DRACDIAAEALTDGELFPAHRRAEVLDKAAQMIASESEELAWLIASEAGKPLKTSAAEVDRCVDTFRFSAAAARSLAGDVVPMDASATGVGRIGFTLRVPIGVVAAISPFNFPLNLVAHKIGPAIAAGCPVVLKPASTTPLTALALGRILLEAGLPGPWLSVIPGDGRSVGASLVSHDVPAVVSFTGSADVGWPIRAKAPRKKVLLELGSAAPLIVEPDANVEAVAAAAVPASFGYAGQSCISTQRIYVHEEIADDFIDQFTVLTNRLSLGNPLLKDTDVGPVISENDATRILELIEEAVSLGAEMAAGGGRDGSLVEPTVLVDPPPTAKVCSQEVFGPVVSIRRYQDFDAMLDEIAQVPLGINAGIFTNRIDRALECVRRLHYGGILINEVPTYRADQQPYGGHGDSGNTREGPAYAVDELTEHRFILLKEAVRA